MAPTEMARSFQRPCQC